METTANERLTYDRKIRRKSALEHLNLSVCAKTGCVRSGGTRRIERTHLQLRYSKKSAPTRIFVGFSIAEGHGCVPWRRSSAG